MVEYAGGSSPREYPLRPSPIFCRSAIMINDANIPPSISVDHLGRDDSCFKYPQALALNHLRKESLDIYNRLHSIAEDIEFVKSVRAAYPHLPILRESDF